MTIEAELPDGTVLEFPDGTDPGVIQNTVKSVLSQGSQQQGQSIPQMAAGGANLLAAGVTGAAEQVVGGLSQLGGIVSGQGPERSIQNAEALTNAIPDLPIGDNAQNLIQSISQKFNASPQMVQDIVNSFSGLSDAAGDIGQKIGEPVGLGATLGAAASTIPAALEAATGLAGARTIPKAAVNAGIKAASATDAAVDIFTRQSPAKQRIAQLIKEGSTDKDTARFKLAKSIGDGRARIKADTVASDAIKQGFDEGVVAAVKGASSEDKALMKRMVSTMKKGKENARFAAKNRPSDVAGESLMSRLNVIQGANRAAGKQLDGVAKDLKGQSLDFAPIGDKFIGDLQDMGINITDDLKLDFAGSDIEGLAGPERAITQIFNRARSADSNDAFAAHRLKRFIDEQVTYGKNAEGLAGRAESVLKSLRRDIDKSLDSSFPEYDRVNTAYAETIGALDAFQDVAGKKMNLTGDNADKATGTLLRRILSNVQSRVTLLDSVDQIESVAEKFKNFRATDKTGRLLEGPARKMFKDDLLNQILFVDELDAVFKAPPRTSLQGQLKQGLEAARSPTDAVIGAAGDLAEKARGINEEGKFRAINKLLSE